MSEGGAVQGRKLPPPSPDGQPLPSLSPVALLLLLFQIVPQPPPLFAGTLSFRRSCHPHCFNSNIDWIGKRDNERNGQGEQCREQRNAKAN